MIHSLSSLEIYTQKGFLDEVASQTTSSVSYRLTRKQNQSSASRRSSKNSSEGSVEGLDLSKFYVRMTPKEEKGVQPIRSTVIKRTSQAQRLKRRSPTPAHTRKGKAEPPKKDQQQNMQKDLMILELQRRCSDQQKVKELLQKRVAVFQKELKAKLKKIDQLQRKNADLIQKEENTSKKLLEFQEIASINQNNLNQAKNSLEKLKSIIKKNRCQELELQNNKLRKQNTTLAQELAVSNQQNAKNKEIIARLEEDLRSLRRENQQLTKGSQLRQKNLQIEKLKQILSASKSQKQEQLQKLIVQKSEAQMRQRLRAEKLQIQLAYLNRKKNEEIQQLKLKHGQLINKIRTKMWVLSEKYTDLREQHQRLKSKGVVQFPRRSLLLTDHRPTEDLFLFDLSP